MSDLTPEQQKAGKTKAAEDKIAELAFQDFIAKDGGQFWVRNLLESCMVHQTTFTGNSSTFYQEGMRAIGLGLMKQVANAHPEALATIAKDLYK
jgi:hypothetical protein